MFIFTGFFHFHRVLLVSLVLLAEWDLLALM